MRVHTQCTCIDRTYSSWLEEWPCARDRRKRPGSLVWKGTAQQRSPRIAMSLIAPSYEGGCHNINSFTLASCKPSPHRNWSRFSLHGAKQQSYFITPACGLHSIVAFRHLSPSVPLPTSYLDFAPVLVALRASSVP